MPIPAATTGTSTLVANPDGTLTLKQYLEPVRKDVGGTWRPLDATLRRGTDGTVSPAVTISGLTLSGGGRGPLATMRTGGRSLSLTLPVALPSPTLSGATATYRSVLPGVDLAVTADTQGGFSEVLIVGSAAAAADPRLADLAFGTSARGVTLATDAAGNITAKDRRGVTYFAAPAPLMWDSASAPVTAAVTDPATGRRLDARTGDPVASSTASAGEHAHVAAIRAAYTGGAIHLRTDMTLLRGQHTVYPVYLDPQYSAGGGVLQNWTYVSSAFDTTSYWDTTDQEGLRVGDNDWESPYFVARAFATMSVSSAVDGATVESSTFYATEIYAPSCTATNVELWQTSPISSATTWDNQPGWTARQDTADAAHGYDSSCPAASIGWNTKSVMQSAANGGWSNVTLGLRATNESDGLGWKKFDHATMFMSTTYDHAPNTPTKLTTSPATSCTAADTIGNGDVTLYAGVSDPDGGGLTTTFTAWNTATGAKIDATPLSRSATSATTSSLRIARSVLQAAAGGAVTEFSWNVYAYDGTITGGTSVTCHFKFDPTSPGEPTITDSAGTECSESQVPYADGTAYTFGLAPNATGSTPASYLVQLNGKAATSYTASSGSASIQITPTRRVNVLTVTSVSAGGNIGNTARCVLNATAPATAGDGDMSGDGEPDLVVVGNTSGLPAGLWLFPNTSSHTASDVPVNIGADGTGANTNGASADWNGTQAIVGHFSSGTGYNDVLEYDPSTGAGHILFGNNDDSPLSPDSGVEVNVPDTAFGIVDANGNVTAEATQVADAGNLYNTVAGNPITGFPDLLLELGGSLDLEPAVAAPGGYTGADNAVDLSDTNPTGSGSWSGWSITTALIGGLPAMYARSNSGGQLYYYSPTALESLVSGTTVTPLEVATSGWDSTSKPRFAAADIDGNGTADLWAITPGSGGSVAAYMFNGTSLTAGSIGTIATSTHSWQLNDGTDAQAGAAAASAGDTAGTDTLTGTGTLSSTNGGTTAEYWDTSGLSKSDVTFNVTHAGVVDGSGTGTMATSGTDVVDTAHSFTVSAWLKPDALGGVAVSEDDGAGASMILYPDGNSGDWMFGLATSSDNAGWSYDVATGPAVQLGVWTHVTAALDGTSGVMYLYVNDTLTATATHTARISPSGGLRVSGYTRAGALTNYFRGQISDVESIGTAVDGDVRDAEHYAGGTWSAFSTEANVIKIAAISAAGLPDGDTVYGIVSNYVEYYQIRHVDGSWSALVPIPGGASNYPSNATALAVAADSNDNVYVVSIVGGLEYVQELDYATQVWGAVSQIPDANASGTAVTGENVVSAAGDANDNIEIMSIVNGVEYHQIRYSDGHWSAFNSESAPGSSVTDLAVATTPDGNTQVMSVVGGVEYHQVYNYAAGTWSSFNKLGNSGVTQVAAAGDADGSTQFVSLVGTTLYVQVRNYTSGSWSAFSQVATGVATPAIAGYPLAASGTAYYDTTQVITAS